MKWPILIGGQHVVDAPGSDIYDAARRFLAAYGYEYDPDELKTDLRMKPIQELRCEVHDLRFKVRKPRTASTSTRSRYHTARIVAGLLILSPVIIGVLLVAVPFLIGFFAFATWMTAYDPVMQAEARAQYITPELDAQLTDVKPPRDRSYDVAIHRWWQTDCRWKGIQPKDAPPYVDFALWCDLVHKECGWFDIPIGVDVDEHTRISVADVLRRLEVST